MDNVNNDYEVIAGIDRWRVIEKGTFLRGVYLLKYNNCDAIIGPQGGILSLDSNGCLVYDHNKDKVEYDVFNRRGNIYFSADNYLGTWKFLKKEE